MTTLEDKASPILGRSVPANVPEHREWSKALVAIISAAAGAIAAISGAFALYAALLPNGGTSTVNEATLSNVYYESHVTLGSYYRDYPVALTLQHNPQTLQELKGYERHHRGSLAGMGTIVDFEYKVVGYEGVPLYVRWTALDAKTHVPVGTSELWTDHLPLSFEAQKKNGDEGSWALWVNNKLDAGRPIVLMLELYDGSVGTRLTYVITPPISYR